MKHLLLLLLALALLAAGCRSLQETGTDTPLQVKTGDEFTIVVHANPSTGYRWRLAEPLDETIVHFLAHEYRADKPVQPGSGGWDVWTFEALGPGETTITLNNFPPDSDTTPCETTTFTITVH